MLKMSTTISKRQTFALFSVFRVTYRWFCGLVLKTVCSVICFSYSRVRGLFEYTLCLRNPHRNKSGGVRSGDRSGQKPHPTMQLPRNAWSEAVVVFAVCAVVLWCWNKQSLSASLTEIWIRSDASVTCHMRFLCPKILLPLGVLLSYAVLPCQGTHC
jgi:hypothetical protein